MEKKILPEAERYTKQNQRRRIWKKIVQTMACVVVFCTTYALILPAITMEKQCELEEHSHTEECYAQVTSRKVTVLDCSYESLGVHVHDENCFDTQERLVCGYGDYLVHTHESSCLDEEGNLLCGIPEVEVHVHSEECYAPEETEPAHVHGEDCYEIRSGELLCQIPEAEGHIHTEGCYSYGDLVCGQEEREGHTHGSECSETVLVCDLTVEPHVHDDSCYRQLVCTLSTEPVHVHDDSCSGKVLVCENADEGHIHDEDCYEQLVCELSTEPAHVHDDSCSGSVLDCDLTEQEHVHTEACYQTNMLCELVEQTGHSHSAECYESTLSCTLEETEGHRHGSECYAQETVLICEITEEGSGEEQTEPESVLVCGLEEVILHTHEDSCNETHTDENGESWKERICPELEVKEHVHTESCFVTKEIPVDTETLTCTESTEGHVHSAMCYGTWELVCGLEEHTHTAECTPMLGLPDEDRTRVAEVIALIEPLPTYDEIMAKLDEFYEAEDTEGEEAYLIEVYAQVDVAYRAYTQLGEELQPYVTNADKLMELEFIWSRVTLEDVVNSAQVHITTNSDGTVLVPVTGVNIYKTSLHYRNFSIVVDDLDDSDGVTNETAESILGATNLDFVYHTAIVIEKLDSPQISAKHCNSNSIYEYFVDAIITGQFAKDTLTPKTDGGFILYITNEELKGHTISRGDLVAANFWYGSEDGKMAGVTLDETTNTYIESGSANQFGLFEFANAENVSINYATPSDLNATVKVFDYDFNVNTYAFTGSNNYRYWHGFKTGGWGYDGWFYNLMLTDYNPSVNNFDVFTPGAETLDEHDLRMSYSLESVEGYYEGGGSPSRSSVDNTVGPNGYPMYFGYAELDELFAEDGSVRMDGTPVYQGTMTDGGGLFQKDSEGYYYYDSLKNAAYYDATSNRFMLYEDLIVRPWYDAANKTDEAYGNFLPFNKITSTNVTSDQALLDAGITSANAALGNTSQKPRTYLAGTVARLEEKVNVNFGLTVEFDFFMPKDGLMNGQAMEFDFHGDDDVFVYIDDVLVLNIAGIHGAESGYINFQTGTATDPNNGTRTFADIFGADAVNADGTFSDYTKHNLKFFYMERGGNISYCRLRFNMPTLPDNALLVSKNLESTGDTAIDQYIASTLSYDFRVMKADESGTATDDLFIQAGTTYTILENGVEVGIGKVGTGGIFSLKAGQTAQFDKMLEKGSGTKNYVVEEILPDDLVGQYGDIQYEVSGAGGEIEKTDGPTSAFTAFQTGTLSAETTNMVTYRNKVDTEKLSVLKIRKAEAEGATIGDTAFQIQVSLGGNLLPVGTEYTVGTQTRTVSTAGIIELKKDETAVLTEGIISGTKYTVTEILGANSKFTPSYSGTVIYSDKTTGTVNCTADKVEDEFPLSSVVEVVVTNADYDFSVEIPIYKQAIDNDGTATFNFNVVQVYQSGNNQWTAGNTFPGTSITVQDDSETSGQITIGFDSGKANGSYYFKICEQRETDDFIYDENFYIAEIIVENGSARVNRVMLNTMFGNEVDRVLFTNRKSTSLVVSKEVSGGKNYSGKFEFEVKVYLNNTAYTDLPTPADGAGYTVSGNTITFQLGHNEAIEIPGLPCNADVVVTETMHDGFYAYYRVVGEHTENVVGDTVTVNVGTAGKTVRFVNQIGYELPETGGAGITSYTMGGLLLMAAAILLYIHNPWRRKEGKPSF